MAGVLLLLAAAYWRMFERILANWTMSQKVFALVILAISLYMVWHARCPQGRETGRTGLLWGTIIGFLGCLLLLAGEHSGTSTLVEISFPVTLWGLCFLIAGAAAARVLLIPIAYLFFAFPIPVLFMDRYSGFFQRITAIIAEKILWIVGFPVFRSAELIILPHINLEVARVCSGSHHIVSLLGLAIPIAFLTQQGWFRRGLVIVSGFAVGIFANGLRVALIGIWTHYNGQLNIHGPFSVLLISTFVVGFGSIFLLSLALALRSGKSRGGSVSAQEEGGSLVDHLLDREGGKGYPAAVAILVLGVIHLNYLAPRDVPRAGGANLPESFDGWKAVNSLPLLDPGAFPSCEETSRVFLGSDGSRLDIFLGYYSIQSEENDVFDSRYAPENISSRSTVAGWKGAAESGPLRVYRYYIVDGTVTANSLSAKARIAIDSVLRRRNAAAIAVIATRAPASSWKTGVERILRKSLL